MVVIVALKGALRYQEDLIGGQGGCRAHYLIENGFTVRRVCRFATYPNRSRCLSKLPNVFPFCLAIGFIIATYQIACGDPIQR